MAMDQDTFVRLVTEQKDRVHNYALWMLHDREDACEIAQESLMRLWQHRTRVHPAAAGSWLLRTTHNLCLDRLRRRQGRSDPVVANLAARPAEDGPDAGQAAERHELREQVGRVLQTLSPRDRAVLVMREFEGMSYEEMAKVLRLRLSALKVALHRARDRFREGLIRAGVTP
jgi:RNA polymerase sigma-70 factor (ECF subfamily)